MDLIIALSPILWLVIALSVLKIAAHKIGDKAMIKSIQFTLSYGGTEKSADRIAVRIDLVEARAFYVCTGYLC